MVGRMDSRRHGNDTEPPFLASLSGAVTERWPERAPQTTFSLDGVLIDLGAVRALLTPPEQEKQFYFQTRRLNVACLSADYPLSDAQSALLQELTQLLTTWEDELAPGELGRHLAALQEAESKPAPQKAEDAPLADDSRASDDSASQGATVKLCSRCNLDCSFCKERPKILRSHLDSFPAVQQVLDRLRQQGINGVSFDGGEAALSPLLPEAIRYANSIGFTGVQVVTNGIRFADGAYLESLIDAGLHTVNVSVHAVDPETARAIYGRDPTAQQLRGLQNLSQASPRISFAVSTVLVEANVASLDRILATVQQFAPRQINLIYCLLNYLPDQIQNVRLARLDDGRVVQTVLRFIEHHADLPFRLRHFPHCQLPEDLLPHLQLRGKIPANVGGSASLTRPAAPNRWLCRRCPHRHACYFPMLPYLLQRLPWPALLTGSLLSLLGRDVMSQRFQRGEID